MHISRYAFIKSFPFAICLLFTFVYNCKLSPLYASFPYDTRTDSIRIDHYTLGLEITDFVNKSISGHTVIQATTLVGGISSIRLDLMNFTVDSVKMGGIVFPFTFANDQLFFDWGLSLPSGTLFQVDVYYHGVPHFEPGFGGFHFSSGYAYNIGVAFNEIPHNFGRTWFPCFDNFITRSTYTLEVTTADNHMAVCSGMLDQQTNHGNGTQTWKWEVYQKIPSYLVSVAVSDFDTAAGQYQSITGNMVPYLFAARSNIIPAMTGSFQNVQAAFDIYENLYGPYRWDRVGYCVLPVASGAMEHAMNIAYPSALINGQLTYEDIVAHELSHHWWGNLVTCRTAEDMWINEGMAVYSEYVYNEQLYGRTGYDALVRNAHKELLHKAHVSDNGYWPVSGVPQQYTYGVTSYQKGADMVHTLRSYLGDSLFFQGLQHVLEFNAYTDMDAAELRDSLEAATGVQLDDFFADWIMTGGWLQYSIDSLQYVPNGNMYDVTLYVHQKTVGRTHLAHNVPFTITIIDPDFHQQIIPVTLSGEYDVITFSSALLPAYWALNLDERLSQAVTADQRKITSTGNQNISHANLNIQVTGLTDSILLITEHNWVAPDPVKDWSKGLLISPQRYWRIGGIWNGNPQINATFAYTGRTSGTNSYLDHLLITGTEDSLTLLYRPSPAHDWEICPFPFTRNMGNPTDLVGTFTVNGIQPGEYTWAVKGGTVSVQNPALPSWKISPNPASDQWNLHLDMEISGHLSYRLIDIQGHVIETNAIQKNLIQVGDTSLPVGVYIIQIFDKQNLIGFEKIIKSL